jgi:hypothetical protein
MAAYRAWTVVLCCYNCNGKFTARHLELDRISVVPLITSCPHCLAQSHVVAGSTSEENKLHRIFDLREETEPAYRKITACDTWHFDHNCSQWPITDFVELEIPPNVGELCNECKAKLSKSSYG